MTYSKVYEVRTSTQLPVVQKQQKKNEEINKNFRDLAAKQELSVIGLHRQGYNYHCQFRVTHCCWQALVWQVQEATRHEVEIGSPLKQERYRVGVPAYRKEDLAHQFIVREDRRKLQRCPKGYLPTYYQNMPTEFGNKYLKNALVLFSLFVFL